MTLRRSIDAVRRVVPPAATPQTTVPDSFTGPDGRRWVVVGYGDGPMVFLPGLDPVDGPAPDGLAGFLATAFDDGRSPE